jgi:hypothetical protein
MLSVPLRRREVIAAAAADRGHPGGSANASAAVASTAPSTAVAVLRLSSLDDPAAPCAIGLIIAPGAPIPEATVPPVRASAIREVGGFGAGRRGGWRSPLRTTIPGCAARLPGTPHPPCRSHPTAEAATGTDQARADRSTRRRGCGHPAAAGGRERLGADIGLSEPT